MWKWVLLYAAGMLAISGQFGVVRSTGVQRSAASHEFKQPQVLSPETNIHFTGRYCTQCHEDNPTKSRRTRLKFNGDPNLLCRCHVNTQNSYWHPIGIDPPQNGTVKIADDLPLPKGKISCFTCHDMFIQCRKRSIRISTLRGGPFQTRSAFCFKCHHPNDYDPFDPHLQINQQGEMLSDTCMYCHLESPAEFNDPSKALKFIGELSLLCQRCHMIKGNHSGNVQHYGKTAKAKTRVRMKKMEAKHQVILPLDEKGRVTCVTCHNPHADGVIDSSSPAAKGADLKFRHRLAGNMCIVCHDK